MKIIYRKRKGTDDLKLQACISAFRTGSGVRPKKSGKTYFIRTIYKGRFAFYLTGIANATLNQQLENFNTAMKEQHPRGKSGSAANWMEAFQMLRRAVERSADKKKIIFIDELPWFDTPHSGFMPDLEHFWNSWASGRKDILMIVCGSAASWMINRLINNKGGLHNRVTQKIKIEPFTLAECEEFLRSRKILLDRYQIVQLYMVLGGIPFYWEGVQKGLSASQNINKLCFEPNGLLRDEFGNLFRSFFAKAGRHEAIITALAKKAKGLSTDEISTGSRLANGGGLTRLLDELEQSGFIRKYAPFGKISRNSLYQLCDFFSLFHMGFIRQQNAFDNNYWQKMTDSPRHRAWSGYAFEQVCLTHLIQIKQALGITGVETQVSSWRSEGKTEGAQVDLVIDRRDGVINLCEMKFSISAFIIDKKYSEILRNKAGIFKKATGTKKAVFTTLVTTHGLQQNAYSGNVQNDINMEALFERG